MAGWGDDPELERLRSLIDEGWEVTEVTERNKGLDAMNSEPIRLS